MESVAPLAAVAQNFEVLHPADEVFHPGAHPAALGIGRALL